MKLVVISNSIITLEDVRRVDLHESTSKHVSHGKPYTVTDYELRIYRNHNATPTDFIHCDTQKEAKELMAEIADILSKD